MRAPPPARACAVESDVCHLEEDVVVAADVHERWVVHHGPDVSLQHVRLHLGKSHSTE